jgi:hypothetical protein
MKVDAALVELLGVRLAVAYVHDSWVRPGVGDQLIARLMPFLPPMPIMLVSEDGPARAYAPFQTRQFFELLPTARVQRFEIDLSEDPEDEEDLPF